jgi:hypothetical protein
MSYTWHCHHFVVQVLHNVMFRSCGSFYDFVNEKSDLRTGLVLVKLAALEMRAILLSTTARPPIKFPPPLPPRALSTGSWTETRQHH